MCLHIDQWSGQQSESQRKWIVQRNAAFQVIFFATGIFTIILYPKKNYVETIFKTQLAFSSPAAELCSLFDLTCSDAVILSISLKIPGG